MVERPPRRHQHEPELEAVRLTSVCACKDTRLARVDVDVDFEVTSERTNRSSKCRRLRELWVPYALALLGSEVK